jgi:FixJ family two-component response regulator
VFVVSAHHGIRECVAAHLEKVAIPVCTFNGPAAFRKHYRADMTGCLLFDLGASRGTGIEYYQQLLQEGKRLPAIFLTARPNVSTVVAAMKTGAVDCLEPPLERQVLIERVREALLLDAQWRAAESRFADLQTRIAQLTERDLETLELIRTGDTNKAIATKLLITERAVEMRRASMMRKLKVKSVAELIELVAIHRVLDELRNQVQLAPPAYLAE